MQTINRHTRLYTSARGNRVEFSLHWSATSARPNRNLKVLEKGFKVFGALFKVGPEQPEDLGLAFCHYQREPAGTYRRRLFRISS